MTEDDWLVVLDFDGTVTMEDAAEAMLAEYADPSWLEIDASYARGEIGVEEMMNRQFELVHASRIELVDFVLRRAVIRPCFREFAEWAADRRIEVVLLSAGLDFYIEAVFEREGIGRYFGRSFYLRTEFGQAGIRCRMPSLKHRLEPLADYKRAVVEELREEGRSIAYAGDGHTDRLAAESADLVFARRRLLEHCQTVGVSHVPFEDFQAVRLGMERAISRADGLASPDPS